MVAEISGDGDNFVPCVYTMDGMPNPDNDAKLARLWYAKFFGLYTKQFYNPSGLSDDDFTCEDMIDMRTSNDANYIKTDEDRKTLSILKQEARSPRITQYDNYNCGIIGLVYAIEMYRGEEKFHRMSPNDQVDALDNLRLKILSMIRAVYELMNDEFYLPFADHLYFHKDSGDYTDIIELNRWDKIHAMFDHDVYTYECDEDDDKYINSNTIKLQKSEEEIDAEFEKAFPKPKPTPKKRPPSPVHPSTPTPVKKKTRRRSLSSKKVLPAEKTPLYFPSITNISIT